jgi:hypothetical protein
VCVSLLFLFYYRCIIAATLIEHNDLEGIVLRFIFWDNFWGVRLGTCSLQRDTYIIIFFYRCIIIATLKNTYTIWKNLWAPFPHTDAMSIDNKQTNSWRKTKNKELQSTDCRIWGCVNMKTTGGVNKMELHIWWGTGDLPNSTSTAWMLAAIWLLCFRFTDTHHPARSESSIDWGNCESLAALYQSVSPWIRSSAAKKNICHSSDVT